MLSAVIQALKKSVMFLCTPFANRCLIYSDWAFESPCIAHQPEGIHPVQIHLIGIRNSPDHCRVRNKEVKFICYSLGQRFSVRCPYQRESVLQRLFLKKIYDNFVGTLETARNREVSIPRGLTVLLFIQNISQFPIDSNPLANSS